MTRLINESAGINGLELGVKEFIVLQCPVTLAPSRPDGDDSVSLTTAGGTCRPAIEGSPHDLTKIVR
jgi:hypothetical protein